VPVKEVSIEVPNMEKCMLEWILLLEDKFEELNKDVKDITRADLKEQVHWNKNDIASTKRLVEERVSKDEADWELKNLLINE